MKHMYESAIDRHYLESVLPHPTFPVQRPIPKTKDFFKPEQFIWNNPHRASHQMYKFYHAYNEHYQKNKEPILRQQEQVDRENAERERIIRLIEFRNKTRDQFFQKQRSRQKLEDKVYSEAKGETEKMYGTDRGDRDRGERFERSDKKSVKTDHNILGLESQYGLTQIRDDQSIHARSVNKSQPYTNFKSLRVQPKSHRIIKIEETYKQGLKKYDIKTEQINRMINNQNEQYHKKIRSQFLTRKLVNDETNTRFYQKGKKSTLE